ncbi:MAG: L-serine ammonia-lyase [Myxococcales bacterium]|nr:L-serine ammonia-lyase [Myxococcales bacterium]
MFTIGIGPSSSHTVGPMRAARRFVCGLQRDELLTRAAAIKCELFGSLGQTGRGHGSGPAVLLGLEGAEPETVEPDRVPTRAAEILERGRINLLGVHEVRFRDKELVFHRRQSLPGHPNGMRFTALADGGELLRQRVYYSIGGGFVIDDDAARADRIVPDATPLPLPFRSGAELLARCREHGLSVSTVQLRNELVWRDEDAIRSGLLELWGVMRASVERGCQREGILPGGLRVRRRAAAMHRRLKAGGDNDPLRAIDWVNLFALAVNEENAAGGRVVTAPTNGAAGIIPAVISYYTRFSPGADDDGVVRFLLAAGAIGVLYKTNASISGAEVGCQGEVGVACSMAAAGLVEARGGSPQQVEDAAEIAMEHHLGLTCDPVGGLVQIPCIERNAIAASTAVTAARLALRGDGEHYVSLDAVVETMRQTGIDMSHKYKETSEGGLAVNVIEC